MSYKSHGGLWLPLNSLLVFPADAEGKEQLSGQVGPLVTWGFFPGRVNDLAKSTCIWAELGHGRPGV